MRPAGDACRADADPCVSALTQSPQHTENQAAPSEGRKCSRPEWEGGSVRSCEGTHEGQPGPQVYQGRPQVRAEAQPAFGDRAFLLGDHEEEEEGGNHGQQRQMSWGRSAEKRLAPPSRDPQTRRVFTGTDRGAPLAAVQRAGPAH